MRPHARSVTRRRKAVPEQAAVQRGKTQTQAINGTDTHTDTHTTCSRRSRTAIALSPCRPGCSGNRWDLPCSQRARTAESERLNVGLHRLCTEGEKRTDERVCKRVDARREKRRSTGGQKKRGGAGDLPLSRHFPRHARPHSTATTGTL